MRILFAGDEHPYSEYALKETIKLAMNTWADVTLLGVSQALPGSALVNMPASKALRHYRETFLNSWSYEDSPYEMGGGKYEWIPVKNGVLEEMKILTGRKKDFKVRLRTGNPSREILTESQDDGSDLIVIGSAKEGKCEWVNALLVPQQVVDDADCSVLIVKEQQPVTKIVACLDQGYISQESLEMINQMITIHGACLDLIGLSQDGDMEKSVYTRLIEIGDYYSDRQIEINTRLMDISDFEQVIAQEIKQDLLALWLGKKSLLNRFFSRGWVGRFVSKCPTSVLVMR
ncbi:MAG: universal stress protein [Deltaproteobacteria bacterium]|nr:universal stress protein [Deltaproteobacteria bacterium]